MIRRPSKLILPCENAGVVNNVLSTMELSDGEGTMNVSAPQRVFGPTKAVARGDRIIWLVIAIGAGAILGAAFYLRPDSRGYGTHEQLGMPPCSFIVMSGLPCPTCGMTTSFADTVRGRLHDAFMAQPAGLVLCLATMATFVYALCVAATGIAVSVKWDRISVRLALGLAFLILSGWAFKIAYGLLTGTLPTH